MQNPMLNAILRWSIMQTDGTRPSDARELTAEDKEFLSKAMDSMVVDETCRIKGIIEIIKFGEDAEVVETQLTALSRAIDTKTDRPAGFFTKNHLEEPDVVAFHQSLCKAKDAKEDLLPIIAKAKETALTELEDRVLSIDNAMDLHKMGGLAPLIDIVNSRQVNLASLAAQVLGNVVQNNPKCQEWATELKAVPKLMRALLTEAKVEGSATIKSKALFAMSSLVREHAPAEIEFYSQNGLSTLAQLLVSGGSNAVRRKSVFFLGYLLGRTEAARSAAVREGVVQAVLPVLTDEEVTTREAALKLLTTLAEDAATVSALLADSIGLVALLRQRQADLAAITEKEDQEAVADEVDLVKALLARLAAGPRRSKPAAAAAAAAAATASSVAAGPAAPAEEEESSSSTGPVLLLGSR